LIFSCEESGKERKESEGPFILSGVVGGLYKASLNQSTGEAAQLINQWDVILST
jgi:hypothetical protein